MIGGIVVVQERFGGEMFAGDGVVNEGDESSTTYVTRTVLADSGVVGKGVD